MSGYTKLFSDILVSTVWELPLASKVVWITMLAMKDKHGEVSASVPGLAKMAGVSIEQCETALTSFLLPDPHSRTKAHEGRRIEEIDGGWRLLNADKYRDMMSDEDQRDRERIRKKRQRDKMGQDGTSQDKQAMSRHTDTDPKADPDPDQNTIAVASLGVPVLPDNFLIIWDLTGKRGSREAALKAWKRRGRPSSAQVLTAWDAYMLSERPAAGFVKDLSTWLNQGCHLQEWKPARSIGPPKARETHAALSRFLYRTEEGENGP